MWSSKISSSVIGIKQKTSALGDVLFDLLVFVVTEISAAFGARRFAAFRMLVIVLFSAFADFLRLTAEQAKVFVGEKVKIRISVKHCFYVSVFLSSNLLGVFGGTALGTRHLRESECAG
jgi:hypothetical protein